MHQNIATFERGIEALAVEQVGLEECQPDGCAGERQQRVDLGGVVGIPDSAMNGVSAVEEGLDNL